MLCILRQYDPYHESLSQFLWNKATPPEKNKTSQLKATLAIPKIRKFKKQQIVPDKNVM